MISGDLDGTVLIWRTSDGQKVREMKATPLGLTSLIVDRTGRRIAVGGDDGAVAMFEGSLLGAPLLEELRRADIEWLQERLGAPSAVEEEPWIRFLLALHLCRFGHDIELDTSPIAVGSFHIQLEG